MAGQFLKVGDVAAVVGVSEQTVRTWCRTGVLRAIRPLGTKQWLIDAAWLDQWLATPVVAETVESLHAPYRARLSDEELVAEAGAGR